MRSFARVCSASTAPFAVGASAAPVSERYDVLIFAA